MTNHTEMEQREKFEAWAEEVGAQPWGYLKKQRNPSGGYSVQIYTYMWSAWKAAGAELVEALEKAQESNEFLKGQLSELANFNPDWDKLEASYESWREIAAELLVAKERIAELESEVEKWKQESEAWEQVAETHLAKAIELESRTVKLPKKFKTSMYGTSLYEDRDILKMLTDAGIKWEAE